MAVSDPAAEDAVRWRILERLGLLHAEPEPVFDRLTRVAAAAIGTPIALLTFVGPDRQWIASRVGWDARTTPLSEAFCVCALGSTALLEVPDASLDPRFLDYVLVSGPLAIRFYAGHSVVFEGTVLGTLCVLDRVARQLDARQRAILADLAGMASDLLKQRQERLLRTEQEEAAAGLSQALREVEDRFRLLWQTTPDVVVMLDSHSRIQFVNPAMHRVFGHEPEALRGRDLAIIQPERLRAHHRRGFQRYLDTGVRQLDWRATEALGLHADGHEFAIEVSFSDMDLGGQRIFAACIRDISARKAAEAAQRGLAEQLRQAQKMEAIGVLAGGVAHDFNNVLAGILGNVALALQDLNAQHAATPYLQQIQRGGRRGRELVQQILSFARRQPPALVFCGLNGLVEDSVALLRSTLPVGARLQLDLQANELGISADATQIAQVVMNLCTNAFQALGDSPGVITIGTAALSSAEATARQPQLTPGRYAHLWVSDSGHGMDAETLARVFEPFFTTKPTGQGTGLGLSVVHGIIGAHGGGIEVESTVGRGSAFHVYLPLCAGLPPSLAADAESQTTPCGQGQRVLYVDDDEVMVLMIDRLLQRLGYRARVLDGPHAALAAMRADPQAFDIVVTDFDMPQMSGLHLARELLALRPDLPIIISSGNVTEAMRSEAAQVGVRALVQKQHTVEELGGLLAALLR